jgi:hypothetical protein
MKPEQDNSIPETRKLDLTVCNTIKSIFVSAVIEQPGKESKAFLINEK